MTCLVGFARSMEIRSRLFWGGYSGNQKLISWQRVNLVWTKDAFQESIWSFTGTVFWKATRKVQTALSTSGRSDFLFRSEQFNRWKRQTCPRYWARKGAARIIPNHKKDQTHWSDAHLMHRACCEHQSKMKERQWICLSWREVALIAFTRGIRLLLQIFMNSYQGKSAVYKQTVNICGVFRSLLDDSWQNRDPRFKHCHAVDVFCMECEWKQILAWWHITANLTLKMPLLQFCYKCQSNTTVFLSL